MGDMKLGAVQVLVVNLEKFREQLVAVVDGRAKQFSSAERIYAVHLIEAAMTLKQYCICGDDCMVEAIQKIPEPHHRAAMAAARAFALHDGGAFDNPFENEQLRRVYDSELKFSVNPGGKYNRTSTYS